MCSVAAADRRSAYYLDKKEITSEKRSAALSDVQHTYRKRAIRKGVTSEIVIQLAALQSPLEKKYRHTLICGNDMKICVDNDSGEERYNTEYCGNRWCTVCTNRRSSQMQSAYTPAMEAMKNPHFVTLTIVSVPIEYDAIVDSYNYMQDVFRKIKDSMRKQGVQLSGIRKFETNINLIELTCNPHYHVLVDGFSAAHTLRGLWMEHIPNLSWNANKVQKAKKNTLKELFKYTTKQVSKEAEEFVPEYLDIVYQALQGRRTLQNFGSFKKSSVSAQNDAEELHISSEEISSQKGNWEVVDVFRWNPHRFNWVNSRGDHFVPDLTAEETYNARKLRKQRMQLLH